MSEIFCLFAVGKYEQIFTLSEISPVDLKADTAEVNSKQWHQNVANCDSKPSETDSKLVAKPPNMEFEWAQKRSGTSQIKERLNTDGAERSEVGNQYPTDRIKWPAWLQLFFFFSKSC